VLLSCESLRVGSLNRRRGVELAELALAVVEGSAGLLGERAFELRVLALARLSNARRLEGDLKGAGKEFQRIKAMPAGLDLDPRVEAEVLGLEGSAGSASPQPARSFTGCSKVTTVTRNARRKKEPRQGRGSKQRVNRSPKAKA
jgi:hypothetical protein